MRENLTEIYEANYKTREYIARACCDVIEDILKSTYDEENPLTTASEKCSQSTQTEESFYYRHIQEMVEIRQVKPRLGKFTDFENPDQSELFETESYDAEEDQDDQIVENTEQDSRFHQENYTAEDCNAFIRNFTTLRRVQEALDQISYTLGNFLRDRGHLFMDRNIFSLNNRGIQMDAPEQDLPLDVRLAAFLLSQGDNGRVDDLIRRLNQNVVVNVNLSYYFKIMLVMLTVNTLLLFKWIIWDHFTEILQ